MGGNQVTTHKVVLLEEEAVAKLRALQKELHGGTDRERDFGHRLWLVLNGAPVMDMVDEPVQAFIDENGNEYTPVRH